MELNSRPINRQSIRDAIGHLLSSTSRTTPRSYVRREMKQSVRSVVDVILDAGWEAFVVGGTIRDAVLGPLLVGPSAYYPRDIDIVVVGVSHAEIKGAFSNLYRRDTRFGGVHLVDCRASGLQILYDVWALEQTWAFTVASLPKTIQNFQYTPFLNLDTAVVELGSSRGKGRQVFEQGFVDGVNSRMLEINFEPNPYPDICMVRSLIIAAKLQFAIGPKLLDFVLRNSRTTSIKRVMAAQISHYGTIRCNEKEYLSWIGSLERAQREGYDTAELLVKTDRQLELWRDYPASNFLSNSQVRESELILA